MSQNFRDTRSGFMLKPLSQIRKKYDTLFDNNKIDRLSEQIDKLSIQINEFNISANKSKVENFHNDDESEERFKEMNFHIEDIRGKNPKERESKIKYFVAEMVRTVMTVGFKYFEQDKFTDKKLRQFFCNNVIANIAKFGHINELTQQQLKMLDSHLEKNVLSFLKQRYPQNESNEANRKFESMITPIDNFQSNSNDLVYQSGIKFQYKKEGDYSSEIMQFLNYLIKITKQPQKEKLMEKVAMFENGEFTMKEVLKEEREIGTLAQVFYREMEDIFQKVEDQSWMVLAKNRQFGSADSNKLHQSLTEKLIPALLNQAAKQNESNISQRALQKQAHKQKYKKQVKQYTKYLIGQKLSDNVQLFSEKDINDKNLKVSNPGLMRILTKWCQQLKKNLEQININSRDERFRMADGSERYIKKQEKKELYIEIQKQEQKLEAFLNQIKENIYFNQREVLKDDRCINAFTSFASEFEGITGYFATFMKKSYENYLISYLNRLIHCILSAQQNFKAKFNKKEHYKIAVNLITFKIGDLLRCKCSSKESEIIALYNYLDYYCKENKDKLEMIRVKNRLSEGTKDILINMKFRQKLLVEMQLAIDEETSKFIKLSDKANHFIYQLERATFGPISEMCNVYTSVDPRFTFFSKKFEAISDEKAQQSRKQGNIKECGHSTANYKRMTHPVWCSQCRKFTASLNIKQAHGQCPICKYIVCSSCLIRNTFKTQRKVEQTLSYEDLIKDSDELIKKKVRVLNLKSKTLKEDQMYIVFFNFKIMLFEYRDKQLKFLGQAKKKSEFNELFLNKYLKQQQEVNNKEKEQLQPLLYKEVVNLMIKNVNKKLRKHFVFEEIKLDDSVFEGKKMETVQTINLKGAELTSLNRLINAFPNVKVLMIHKNKISSLEGIEKLKNLEQLNLEGNNISSIPKQMQQLKKLNFLLLTNNKFKEFPEQLCNITCLERLNFKENKFSKINPQIKKLIKLKNLRLSDNLIDQIPPQIKYLVSLKQLDLSHNKIQKLPEEFKSIQKLEELNLSQNPISQLDDNLFEKFKFIKKINFRKKKDDPNKIQAIPSSLKNKEKLQSIDFENNSITELPQFLFELPNLEELMLASNKISELKLGKSPSSSKLKNLKLSNNTISKLPEEIFSIKTLEIFELGNNNLKQVPARLSELRNLRQVDFSGFQLEQFPTVLTELPKLEIIKLNKNKISSLPKEFLKLSGVLLEILLADNEFKQFPLLLIECQKLEMIKLDKNKLTSLPKQISKFSDNLDQISLSENKFKKFPIQLMSCKHVETLTLNKANIEEIPKQIKNMESLVRFKLLGNPITTLPNQLAQMKKLIELQIDSTLISEEKKKQLTTKSKQLNNKLKIIGEQKKK